MAVLGQNNCTPERIYGPLPQTLFLGCSVKSFSVTAGWGEQSSNLTVELVQDPCIGPKIWWDESLDRQSDNIADPGFLEPDPGVAVYFRMEEDPDDPTDKGGFEYCGLIQSWIEKRDPAGNPAYSVQISDPRVVCDNTQIILDSYPGPTSGVWNLINVYGYLESKGGFCTTSPAGGIGGVSLDNVVGNIANDRGIVWNDIKAAIHTLTASNNQSLAKNLYNDIARDARIVYTGPAPSQEGYGVIKSDNLINDPAFQTLPNVNLYTHEYLIDLTEFSQVITPTYYRVGGETSISLSELISRVSQDASCDFYLELIPVKNGGNVIKIIKVRLVSRASQPKLGVLDDFIAARQADAANANGGVISYTKGEEVRQEDTSTYIMGGNLQVPYEASPDQLLPFFGVDTEGSLIAARITPSGTGHYDTVLSGNYVCLLDFRRLNTTLYNPYSGDVYGEFCQISEMEMRAALGDIDTWRNVSYNLRGDVSGWLADNKLPATYNPDYMKDAVKGLRPNSAMHIAGGVDQQQDVDFTKESASDLDKFYNYIRSYSEEFYGRKFLVNAPFVCVAQDAETSKFRYSHQPSTDGCWVSDDTLSVLGLNHNTSTTDFFRDDVGKYSPILRYTVPNAQTLNGSTPTGFSGSGLYSDLSKMGDENYITSGPSGIAWVKAEVDPRMILGTPLVPSASNISFLLTLPSPVVARTDEKAPIAGSQMGVLLETEAAGTPFDKDLPNQNQQQGDRTSLSKSALGRALAPSGALIPVLNNTEVYGPWGVAGLPGQVSSEKDEGFVPWEYGSDYVMNQAALEKVSNSVAQMRKSERGTVTVAGFPNIPLGAELFSVDTASPPASQGTQKYLETRSLSIGSSDTSLSYWFCLMNAWTGEFGPNVTNVNVNVGPGGFTTEYQFSTFTSRFGSFSKENARRLKEVGQNRLRASTNSRARVLNSQLGAAAKERIKRIDAGNQIAKSDRSPKSAHAVMIGRYTPDNGEPQPYFQPTRRPDVSTIATKDAALGYSSNAAWQSGAIMSMDGFFRPVSLNGGGGFPSIVNPSNFCGSGSFVAQPDGPCDQWSGIKIIPNKLNFLSNSEPYYDFNVISGAPAGAGHDIEIVGRGSSPPADGSRGMPFNIWENEDEITGDGYANDYRFLAHRGPMVMQGWGYDTHGKPVPNATPNSPSDSFPPNFLSNPNGISDPGGDPRFEQEPWPVAPIDLRFDRERRLWVAPQPPRNRVWQHGSGCWGTGSSVAQKGQFLAPNESYDATGAPITTQEATVYWPWSVDAPSGVGRIPTYYDTARCQWYAIPVNRLDVQQLWTRLGEQSIHSKNSGVAPKYDVKRISFGSGFAVTSSGGCGFEDIVIVSLTGNTTGSPSGAGGSGIFINNEPCGGTTGDFEPATYLTFGPGITATPSGSGFFYIDSALAVSGTDDYPKTSGLNLIEFGGGTKVTTNGDCGVLAKSWPETVIGLDECGGTETTRFTTNFEHLKFGSGLVTSVEDTTILVEGGFKFISNDCSDPPSWAGGGAASAAERYYANLEISSGLTATTGVEGKCTLVLSALQNWDGDAQSNPYGWPRKDPDGADRTAPQTALCNAGGSGDPWTGPYVNRLQPQTFANPVAGKGVGIAACNEGCGTAILFSSHIVQGFDTTCTSAEYAQVFAWEFGGDFFVNASDSTVEPYKPGGPVDLSDDSLSIKIDLAIDAEDAGKTMSFVTGISVTTAEVDGTTVVTQVSSSCCEFTVKATCNNNWIITDIPTNGCGCAGGAAEAEGPGGI